MLVTFLYTSPTNGVSGPKIIPSNKDTVTKGTSSFVILLRKSVTFFKELLNSYLLNAKKGS